MIIYSIYKCVNKINGKVYIGFDSKWPCRKQTHYYKSSSNNSSHHHLHHAIRKYGWKSFEWEVIYQSLERDHTLKVMEPYFISIFESFNKGYNETLGGEGTFGRVQTDKTKKILSENITKRNKNSRWYNNGSQNTFYDQFPGEGWTLGRINQKPTTLGNKWYNNGTTQILCKSAPDGWKLGMLSRK